MSMAIHSRRGCPTVRSLGPLAALFLVALLPCSALGQAGGAYIVDPVDTDQARQMSTIRRVLSAGTFGAGEQEAFDKFYENFFLARWSDPKTHHRLTDYRKELGTQLLQAKGAQVHDHLRDLALKKLTTKASQNYHPAVRVNAMLAIGELNQVEAVRSSDNPVPFATALTTVLLPAVKAPTLPDGVKVAALVGIGRHAKLDAPMPPTMQADMIALVQTKTPRGPKADGRNWMRVQAVRVLGAMGGTGTNGGVPNAIATMIADKELRLSGRCVAARALGQLRFGNEGWANAQAAVGVLRQLALDACEAEKDGVLKRRLAFHLSGVSIGLAGNPADPTRNGIGPLAGGGAVAAGLKTSLDTLELLLKDTNLDQATLNTRVGEEAEKIRALAP